MRGRATVCLVVVLHKLPPYACSVPQPVPVIQVPEPGYPMPPGFQGLPEPERKEGVPIPFPMPPATTMPMPPSFTYP
jgi:hypothetical protein